MPFVSHSHSLFLQLPPLLLPCVEFKRYFHSALHISEMCFVIHILPSYIFWTHMKEVQKKDDDSHEIHIVHSDDVYRIFSHHKIQFFTFRFSALSSSSKWELEMHIIVWICNYGALICCGKNKLCVKCDYDVEVANVC